MHIITQKRIIDAKGIHKECGTALDQWYRVMKKAELENFDQMRQLFRGVDKVGKLFVFNIGGNKLRLIAAVHFNRGKVYVRDILTHKEYDKGKWRD